MSGVYIPGMEIPPCHFKTSESYNVHGFWMVYPDGTSKLHIMVDSYDYTVDVVPVPDHGDLKDADELVKIMAKGIAPGENEDGFNSPFDIIRAIDNALTIIPADKKDEDHGA